MWDPADPYKITNPAEEVSFREKDSRDVINPREGYDPFPEPTNTSQPGSEINETEQEKDQEVAPTASETQQPQLRRSSRARVAPGVLDLHTSEEAYEHAEYAMLTGSAIGSIGTGKPGEIGYMPADPPTYDAAVTGSDGDGWVASMGEERQSLMIMTFLTGSILPMILNRSPRSSCIS